MDPLQKPIFVVAPPQSGATFLHDALSALPGVRSLGVPGRAVLDRAEEVDPANRDYDSGRRTAADASPPTADRIATELRYLLTDRGGEPTAGRRLVDATPRNALRIPFLDAIFPDACFLYVYREPASTLANMLEAWRSGQYVTYPDLPDWPGPPWSLLLIPGWRELAGGQLVEVVAEQWSKATRTLLKDLEQLAPERWCVTDYAALTEDPGSELSRLCSFLGLTWSPGVPLGSPESHLAVPSQARVTRRSESLQAVLPRTTGLAKRAHALLATPTSRRPTLGSDPESPLRSVYTGGMSQVLDQIGSSLLVSSPEADRVICIRRDGRRINTHFRELPRPTGVAVSADRLGIGARAEIHHYEQRLVSRGSQGERRTPDACFLPRSRDYTGDIAVHELAYVGAELWVVATRFSCLATLDGRHSFVPRWRPPFISELNDDDRCHLTGLAPVDGRIGFVTALGECDAPDGWREGKLTGGCVIDVASGATVARGLSLPNSPRWHAGRLWVLESGEGALCTIDPESGAKDTVIHLPGFARGLALVGGLGFVGLSRLRESPDHENLGVSKRFERHFCGVCIVDLERGEQVGYLRFEEEIREIFDVALLSGRRFPEIADPGSEEVQRRFVLPDPVAASELV